MSKIYIKAYAKINLTLDVLGKRADGYHQIRTIFQGISLHDCIYLEKGEAAGDGEGIGAKEGKKGKEAKVIELSCNLPELGTGADNLAYQAAHLLAEEFPQISGIKIHLDKQIPLAAGLAGGSTDAAAVLVGINELYRLGLSLQQLRQYGAKLGSDVSFCVYPLTAGGEGRGEILRDCPACPQLWLVVAKPPFSVSTKEVYQHVKWDNLTTRPEIAKVIRALKDQNKELIYQHMANVMEYSTFDLYPQLKDWKQEIERLGASKVIMSGSGPTLLAFMEDQQATEKLASCLCKPGWNVRVVKTINEEIINERMGADAGEKINNCRDR
jgi:4-diphosphocytidyl-2-C-methyl-D-erythritol kinase